MSIKEFSLEIQRKKIHDPRTKRYFDEVYKSFANGCYRSATVMLWSVVVCDLLFKLNELKDLYADVTAEKILNEIETTQTADPYSSKWEKDLIKLVFERTQLLDTASYHKISTIQDHRHLSAHPVISDEDILFEPTEEMVRNDIRNSIESLLTKPPFLSQKILSTILADLEKIKDLMPSDKALLKYLDAKYLKSINKEITLKLFKGLWKFAFRSEDEKSKDNRKINLRAIKLVYDKQKVAIQEDIKSDSNYYSNISSEAETVKRLIEFISTDNDIYESLTDAAKEIIKPVLKENLSYLSIAFFLNEDPKKHITNVSEHIDNNLFKKYGADGNFITQTHLEIVKQFCTEFGLEKDYRTLGISCYINSSDFERADMYYDRFIKQNIDLYDRSDLVKLLDGSNKNNQVYWRNRSRNGDDTVLLLKKAKSIFPAGFDFTQYNYLPIDKIDDDIEENGKEI
jgi:hypothetical protein